MDHSVLENVKSLKIQAQWTREMAPLLKVNVSTKMLKLQAQNTQEIWDTMGRPNLWNISIEEGEETPPKDTKKIKKKQLKKISQM